MTKLMLWRNLWAAATATLGLVVLAAVGTAPASAANLKTFKISGTFFNDYPNPVYSDLTGTGLETGLLARGGSFSGTFTANVDKPFDPIDPEGFFNNVFEDWNVDILSANGEVITNFYRRFEGLYPPDIGTEVTNGTSIYFSKSYYTNFSLYRLQGYAGNIPIYGTFKYGYEKYHPIETYVSSFQISEPYRAFGEKTVFVPEPLSLGGTALAGAMSLWIRHKRKASQSA
ncbi:hypothetical protein NIES4074_12330 [Cylindrospermum sp. NIES-4074]|nr:hypothetical protein NIES4074_12330 [Cylindrospermum sp. NIES-4074]